MIFIRPINACHY